MDIIEYYNMDFYSVSIVFASYLVTYILNTVGTKWVCISVTSDIAFVKTIGQIFAFQF